MSRATLTPSQLQALGERLLLRRLELHLSRRALADRTGLSRTTLLNLERGSGQQPSAETLRQLADVLGLTPLALVAPAVPTPARAASHPVERTLSEADQVRLELWTELQEVSLASARRLLDLARQCRRLERQAVEQATLDPPPRRALR